MKEEEIFIKCGCTAEGMGIEYDEQSDLFYFSYWSQGFKSGKLSFLQRLRYSWHCLRYGKPFSDELIITKDNASLIVEFICSNQKLSQEQMDALIEILRHLYDPIN
tara:strand:+ start:117 stop:434 length:318 start_codon:yes stop_codon:yes gene_type:complete